MSRCQAVFDHIRAKDVLDVATELFDREGYRGTAVRDIADAAGVSVSSLYEMYPSKQSILREIVDSTYEALIAQTEAAVAEFDGDPVHELEAAVWAQCDFRIRCQRACRVADRELINLDLDDRCRAAAQRDRLGEILYGILDEGAARGTFHTTEPEAISRALTSMCAAVGSWYDESAHVVPRQIAQTYCELATKMAGVGFRDAGWHQ